MDDKKYSLTEEDKYSHVLQAYEIAKNYENSFENVTLKEFLDHITLSYATNDTLRSKATDSVNVITMHRSKGLEFKVVFIIGLHVGSMPNDYFIDTIEKLEAERRLFYVAITRAKELLYLSSFKDPLGSTSHSNLIRAGFLAEIPKTALGDMPIKKEVIYTFPIKDKVINERPTPKDIEDSINDTLIDVQEDIKQIKQEALKTEFEYKDLSEDQIEKNLEKSLALSKNILISSRCFIVIIGNLDMRPAVANAILKANSFSKHQVYFYDYDGKGFKINKYFNNSNCIGIIIGPCAHKINGVDSSSLKAKLLNGEGYPYFIDLIKRKITKTTLQESIAKIKWNYSNNN